MAKLLISYDLIRNKDYNTLTDELQRLGAHKPRTPPVRAALR
jgi:hypothetical protein